MTRNELSNICEVMVLRGAMNPYQDRWGTQTVITFHYVDTDLVFPKSCILGITNDEQDSIVYFINTEGTYEALPLRVEDLIKVSWINVQ